MKSHLIIKDFLDSTYQRYTRKYDLIQQFRLANTIQHSTLQIPCNTKREIRLSDFCFNPVSRSAVSNLKEMVVNEKPIFEGFIFIAFSFTVSSLLTQIDGEGEKESETAHAPFVRVIYKNIVLLNLKSKLYISLS
jgi:hypothetical protein